MKERIVFLKGTVHPIMQLLKKVVVFVFFVHKKSILVALYSLGLTSDVSWTILTMSLLPFWALNVVVPLLSM